MGSSSSVGPWLGWLEELLASTQVTRGFQLYDRSDIVIDGGYTYP